jgi:FRG domain
MNDVLSKWDTTTLTKEDEVLRVLTRLQGDRWLCRGHSVLHGSLVPSIDRSPRQNLARSAKLRMERESIDLFRASAKAFAAPGEAAALVDNFIALAVLRHYCVPTRLLDWSGSPFVAAWFAVSSHDGDDAELWAFDEPSYEVTGKEQWRRHPETTTDGSGIDTKFDANLTAFMLDEPPDWIVALYYPPGFPRQNAQFGAYTVTARFGVDHVDTISQLFSGDRSRFRRYVVKASIKPALRHILRERHGLWRGALFPDSAGAAKTALSIFAEGA